MITLIGLPFDAASSFLRGAAAAPDAIRQALHSPASNGWSESGREVVTDAMLADHDDLALPPTEESIALIEAGMRSLFSTGARPIALGGDHSVTYPILRALASTRRDVTIVHIDAHADLYDSFEGSRYSHACPFARIMEEGLAVGLVQVGIRTLTQHQREQGARFGVDMFDMMRWTRGDRPAVRTPIYLSIDLDGLDPAFAPGVSHREPGGLTVREVIALVQSLEGPIVGADIVELNPARDVDGCTAIVAAKLVKEVVDAMASRST